MTVKLPPAAGRAAALAILAAILGLFYFGIVLPVVGEYDSIHDTAAQMQDQIARYRRASRDLAPRQAALTALERRSAAQDGFLVGANDTLVAVQIQNRLKSLTDATKSELRSTQVLPPQDEGALRRISVRGQMLTTVGGALSVFYGLESQYPLLFIDNLDIRAHQGGAREVRGRGGDTGTDGLLDVQFDVYGYMQGGK
jgi:type II secretion system (T2SS) protein M